MSLPDDIRGHSTACLRQLKAKREFYIHTRQAWRLVQQIARKGHPVGIVDLATKMPLPANDLASQAQGYVTGQLAESTFKELSRVLEDWIMGLIQLWLTAYPEDLDLNYDPVTGRRVRGKDTEIQIPLSRLLSQRDISEIFRDLITKTVRSKTYDRPESWFRYIETRLGLGCPSDEERADLCEMKAVRDCIEHNQGIINDDYLNKAGAAKRYNVGDPIQIEEPYLLSCFDLLQKIIVDMTKAAVVVAAGSKPIRRHAKGRE